MLANMKKQPRGDTNSLLYSYYTLAHSTSQQRDSPSPQSAKPQRKNEIESGDETDKSVEPDNEIVESFFMDEINLHTESCSLSSSRENLLDGEIKQGANREGRSGSRPNSRPSSARRSSLKSSELPVDERIKVLEEGLKEADMEREVVLSCLGKEYLERLTMQNCLQEICLKSGYNYEEVKANMDVQSGAKNILDSMIEMRTKEMLKNKSKNGGIAEKTVEGGSVLGSEGNKEKMDVYVKEAYSNKDKNVLDTMTEEKLKEVIAKVIQAEQTKHNIHTKRREQSEENSHTQLTKGPSIACESTTGANNSAKNSTVGSNNIMDALETKKGNAQGIVAIDQSDGLLLSADDNVTDHEKNTASQNDEKTTEKLYVKSEQSEQPKTLELKYKQISGLIDSSIMPSMTDKKPDRDDTSILQSLDKVQTSANKSLDSIDEGIFMLKTFLTELLAKNQRTPGRIVKQVNGQDSNAGSVERKVVFTGDVGVRDGKPRRKLSLNDLQSNQKSDLKSDLKPQRRRSIAEGMDNAKPKISESKRVESRLFRATVASQNKMKDRIARRETESDTESAKKTVEMNGRQKKPKHKISRSVTDVRDYSARSAYTSTEEDSSVDGDDDFRRSLLGSGYDNQHSFKYVHEINQVLSDKEYTKLFSILNMLQDQKRKWEDESRLLKLKIDDLKHSKSDLTHDNSVLRKSLEAANHAIKEINAKVQELKLTIVPLRDENSKLREQNHSLKSKLDLLRKDKAVLLQEFQELKKTKLKYEEKLQLVTDLYQNGRINLDQNNNHPTEAADAFSKGGLKALLETTDNESPNEQSRLRRIRNQDQSKRHSFHGFEKIEELAGNTEELLAEKEKVEEENVKLIKEVMELRKQIAAEKEENAVTDEEILNRRKGWKMQREESKHRIIREILKTESTQAMYGRPYSSCSDLTLADSPEYAGRSVWGGGKKKRPHEKAEGTEENGTGDPRSDWNESIKLAQELKLNQRKEKGKDSSELDDRRSQGYVSFEIGFEKPRKSRVNSWKEESEKIEKRLAMFRSGKEAKAKKVDDKKNNSKKVKNVDEMADDDVSKEEEGKLQGENEDVVDNAFQSEDAQKRDASKPSTQWPIVKEKIQAIYGQPVDLEFAKGNTDAADGNAKVIERDSGRKIDTNGNGESYYSKYEAKELARRERNEVTRSKATRRSVQEMVARHVMQDDEEEISGNENDWSRMESDWQRKSSDAENDYETYKEITKQRQQARNRSKHSSRVKSDTTTSNTTISKTTKSHTTKSNTTKSVRSQSDTTDGKKMTSSDAADSENGSPWVEVPVYLKKNEKERPTKQNKEKKESKNREKTKTVEETISKVESAFSIAKAAGKKLFKKHEKVVKSNSAKDLRENFKRTSGTVMYLDELSNSSSDEDQLPRTVPRRTRSFRRPRPKSDYWSNDRVTENGSWQRGSSRSLRLPKQTQDDMFAVDISIETESENRSANSSFQYDSFNQFNQSAEWTRCQHQQQHHHGNQEHARHRIHSETGTSNTRSAKRPKSPGGFSCEMCRELNKKKTAQEKYCWEKYFPIGETTVDYSIKGYREDYV